MARGRERRLMSEVTGVCRRRKATGTSFTDDAARADDGGLRGRRFCGSESY
ncbi:YhgE/Pip domain-containing protein [Sesbania bispinosa]|nr:YhgE/Pip domain-containing protein [Sesbania bispinosa]